MSIRTSETKAGFAGKTIAYYNHLVGDTHEPWATSISDLLADLMHLAVRDNLDFSELLEIAAGHFHAEMEEPE